MAGTTGSGGLSALGWVAVAGGFAAVALGGLYLGGVIGPSGAPPAVEEAGQPAPVAPLPQIRDDEPDPQDDTVAEPTPPADTPSGSAQDEPAPQVAATDEPDTGDDAPVGLDVPSFDLVRVDADGTTVIAGRAAAGSRMTVLVDAAAVDTFVVDSSGAFVSFLTLGTSTLPRVMTLLAERDGATAASDDEIILAPSPPAADPTIIAEADGTTPPTQPAETTTAEAAEATAEPTAPPAETTTAEAAETPAEPTAPPADTTTAEATEAPTEPTQPPAETTTAEAPETPTEPTQPPAETTTAEAPETPTEPTQPPAETTTAEAPEAPSEPTQQPAETTTAEAPEPAQPATAPAAQQSVAVLRSSAQGVELIQSPAAAAPEVMDRLQLDTIGYSEAGDVQLTGRATGGAVVRVYLDNRAVSDIAADAEGRWRAELLGILPGIYTLRLDELGQDGAVTGRLETPFKREAPEVLNPPQPENRIVAEAAPPIRAVTVQKGDTLWAISRVRYGEGVLYVKVFEANRDNIRNPDLIYPGQVFSLPE